MDAHFNEAGVRFLRGLKRHNDRDWFNERKAVYEGEVKAPMLGVIAGVNAAMLGWAPEHVRAPEKTMMRIYRDIRFSKDKRPYKAHVAAWWARAGMEKTSGAGFYLQVGVDEVLVAAGIYMPDREQLLLLRRYLAGQHREVRGLLEASKLKRLGMTAFAGTPLSRPPKGFAAETDAMDLLVQREWGVSGTLPIAVATGKDLVKELVRRFRAAAELVEVLNAPLLTRPKRTALHF